MNLIQSFVCDSCELILLLLCLLAFLWNHSIYLLSFLLSLTPLDYNLVEFLANYVLVLLYSLMILFFMKTYILLIYN